jgi:prevent-host-death family protein
VQAAEREGQRVIVTHEGKPAAAVVPLDDLQALEALEDARDAEAVRKGLEAYEREGPSWPTLEEVAARYAIKL